MPNNDIDILEIHYHDGKPEVEKNDISKEIHKELHKKDCKCNDADITKSALYAGLPRAKQKRDKSLNARAISSMIESYNKQRNETKFKVSKGFNSINVTCEGRRFECYMSRGQIFVIGKTGRILDMIESPELKNANLDKYFDKIEQYLKEH